MKIWNYMILTVGLVFLTIIAGLPMGFNHILENLGVTVNATDNTITSQVLTNSGFYLAVFGTVGILIGIGAAIFIGGITRTSPENYVILAFITGTLAIYVGVFTSIMNYAISLNSWVTYIVLGIFLPLSAGYIVALVEFFRGTD